jgi:alkanesulfonate monooxygenase
MRLAWYCPSEGDGNYLGTRLPERAPSFDYLHAVVRTSERVGADEVLIPTGDLNDSFDPDAPFAESWTVASALAATTERIRLVVAVNPAAIEPELIAHQAETLWQIAPGRIAINLVAGGGSAGTHGAPRRSHDERYERLGAMVSALKNRFPGPLYLGGASPAAVDLAARVADTYLMWGEPVAAITARVSSMRARTSRPLLFGLRAHIVARSTGEEATAAAAEIVSRAEVAGERAGEYSEFDSVGQARMNAIDADADGWVEPGLWAGIRAVRGGAGTALVGSYKQVAGSLRRYAAAGIDLVIASGYPHLEEVGRVATEVWPLLGDQSRLPEVAST